MKIIGKATIKVGEEIGEEFLINKVIWDSYPRDFLGTITTTGSVVIYEETGLKNIEFNEEYNRK